MKKILLILILILGSLLIAFFQTKPRLSRDTFAKVRIGMRYDEVCRLLGGPPGDYTTGPVILYSVKQDALAMTSGTSRKKGTQETWQGDEGNITILFDDQGFVSAFYIVPGRTQIGFFEKLWNWWLS